MVSAWANKQRLVLGQIKTDEKSNEITAVPQLLDMLDVEGFTEVNAFAKATREHWGIGNSLHWVLDVAFNEDRCRMRKDNSDQNFAVIRHIALNLLKKDDSKMSLKAKRHRCAYDDSFLAHMLFDAL